MNNCISYKNCDHVLEMIYIGTNGKPKCSNCHQTLTDNQMSMMAQKGMAICQDQIKKRNLI